jgi:hypothetical protein
MRNRADRSMASAMRAPHGDALIDKSVADARAAGVPWTEIGSCSGRARRRFTGDTARRT